MARSKLTAVKPTAVPPGKIKMLLSGKPSVGKTWASLDFPSVYFIDVEEGAVQPHYLRKLEEAGGVYFGKKEGALSFVSVLEQIAALATEKHDYKTVVIDSITKLFSVEYANASEKLEAEGKDTSWGRDKKSATSYMRRLVAWLTRINMNVILIAHEKDEWGKNARGEREVIGTTFDGWDKLSYEMNLWLSVSLQGPKRVARVRKTRLEEFPIATSFPWGYSTFAEKYHREIIEGEVKPVTVGTPEQLAELEKLLQVVMVPEDLQQKWLSKAGVTEYVDMDQDQLVAIINLLKGKIQNALSATNEAVA